MKQVRLFVYLIFIGILFSGCANYGTQKQRQAERAMYKEQKAREKNRRKLEKQHFEMQTPEVQKRMKESEKRMKRYRKRRNRRSLWDRIFG